MEMISVDEFCRILGESVSQQAHDTVLAVVNECTKYDVDNEVIDALEVLREYFNREHNYYE